MLCITRNKKHAEEDDQEEEQEQEQEEEEAEEGQPRADPDIPHGHNLNNQPISTELPSRSTPSTTFLRVRIRRSLPNLFCSRHPPACSAPRTDL